jgi:hypothetical protein
MYSSVKGFHFYCFSYPPLNYKQMDRHCEANEAGEDVDLLTPHDGDEVAIKGSMAS